MRYNILKIYGKTLEEIYDYIKPIVMEAGEKALQIRAEGLQEQEKTKNDYVTKADLEVEQFLTYSFFRFLPEVKVLAEEMSNNFETEKSEYMWVIDPIDGTTNFMNNMQDYWAISVGLVKTNKDNTMDSVLGMVYQPDSQVLFYALKGKGAYEWQEVPDTLTKLNVNKKQPLNKGLVCVGFSRQENEIKDMTEFIDKIGQNVSGIRRMGAASIDICNVAKGVFVGYVEETLRPWDYAAGMLILEEAGGKLTDFNNQSLKMVPSTFICSNGVLHDQILSYLN